MTLFASRTLATAVVGIAVYSGAAAAQAPSPILNTLEVRELVTSTAAGDHTRLSAHFSALAGRYEADARRHTNMATAAGGNPNRNAGIGMRDHCRRLATLNTGSAATLRDLAAHHTTLAGGNSSAAPRDAARFEAGAGASTPTEAELAALAAKAATAADHRGLQEYFRTLAGRYTTEAAEHTDFATRYIGTRVAQVATHHQRLAANAREAAKEATAAAEMHGQMAAAAR